MKTKNAQYEILHQTALSAPHSSGVYLWKDASADILYVGKAKNLKNRLSSYFSGHKDVKTRILVSKASSIEYITTDNEYEALILENTLIKQHRPRYNIDLKDDKSYPVARITNEVFPRIIKTRRIIQDGSLYYGPFPNAGAVSTFIDTLSGIYPLRRCKKMPHRRNPCMYYHIGRCAAPCCGKISRQTYMSIIDEIKTFLEENVEKAAEKLENKMAAAAKNLEFEKAGRCRDCLAALRTLRMQNAVVDFNPESRDYIGFYAEGTLVSFAVLKMRAGKLIMRDLYRTRSLKENEELTGEFIAAYYTEPAMIPPRIFVQSKKNLELTEKWLKDNLGVQTHICVPEDTDELARHTASLNMAIHNAKEDIIRRMRERGDTPALEELQKLLNLDALPMRIEGFDIAHLEGKFPVASLVSFYNGNPDKKNYRIFRLKTLDGRIDDFESMREATSRRYTRLLNEQAQMPDLIMIDGGIGQINAVKGVLDALGLHIPLVGLAEKNEDIYVPKNNSPIRLPKRSDALRLLQRVRDEAHRFATSRNLHLRVKENTVNPFTLLPHIGEKRALLITEKWDDFARLAAASVDDIAAALTLSFDRASDVKKAALIIAEKQKESKRKDIYTEPFANGVSASGASTNGETASVAAQKDSGYMPYAPDK
ncbi:excinuclease ABC subunit UvrC [Treponema sp. OMZ 840]|uniref:excinuclease ABC subunit UvrC n=1 Tax=Treponema sp. OMZ 840 TaxID=244313 RepID=UPI003D919BE4